jgi:hypothetical protein
MMRDDDLTRRLESWLQDGPEHADPAVIDATFAPVSRLPQRRAPLIRLPSLGHWGRLPGLAAAAILLILVAAVAISGLAGGGPFRPVPSPTPTPRPGPTFELMVGGAAAATTYRSDSSAGLAQCATPATGSWNLLYEGGQPHVSIDMVVPDGVATIDDSDRVAMEIQISDQSGGTIFYVRFDPSGIRGGDAPGRSSATVSVSATPSVATVAVEATTPLRTSGKDGPPTSVTFFLTCQR